MVPSNRHELIEELEATHEKYVRKKLKLAGYAGWQKPVVEHWLGERDDVRRQSAARSTAFWGRLRVVFAGIGLAASAIWYVIEHLH